MKCASVDCTCAELSVTAPCVVCGRGVHHICSNELYDSGTLAERFCSASCLYKRKTMTSPPSTSEMEAQDSASQLSAIPASQESALSTAESVELSLPPNDVVDLTMASSTETQSSASSSSTSPGVDAFGIPLEVYHYRQQNSRHGVWDVAHRLTTPYTSMGQNMEAYTHVSFALSS